MRYLVFLCTLLCFARLFGQSLLQLSPDGTILAIGDTSGRVYRPTHASTLLSFEINERRYTLREGKWRFRSPDSLLMEKAQLEISLQELSHTRQGWKGRLIFRNISKDTLRLHNVVPFGAEEGHPYISGKGNHGLSRSHLFLPGKSAVNVILPDNAWELGYASIPLGEGLGLAGLTRRVSWTVGTAQRKRFETILLPGGSVIYHYWTTFYRGAWQEGLRKVFQERYLYDVDRFDETLYSRPDLQWIRSAYAMHLIMAWDHELYDGQAGGYRLQNFLQKGERLYGGNDVIGIWQNWPTLGLDQRNQWDLLRDLPGGTSQIKALADSCRRQGTRFFISYNPWDESTRWEDHHAGMSAMIAETGADGVVLDTEGKSRKEHQEAADRVRSGVIMYSEGMAVPKDMPGIVAGRVHNALYYPPILNLNKLIRPDFAIFRVAELYKEPIRREYALSFFNGYGTELNIFRPGRPEWVEADYRFWGLTLRILRENSSQFIQKAYTPLVDTRVDGIYANRWPSENKVLYTLFSLLPEGYKGPLLTVDTPREGFHYVDLWNHEAAKLDTLDGKVYVVADIEGFSGKWLGTNNEGAVGAIALLPAVLKAHRTGDSLYISASRGDEIKIWAGMPDYEKQPKVFGIQPQAIRLQEHFGRYEGKFVVQVFEKGELLDETGFLLEPGTARLTSKPIRTKAYAQAPQGMVKIPAGTFLFKTTYGDNFIPNPPNYPPKTLNMRSFYMDIHPVTNAQYLEFITASAYKPSDTANFLKHWENGRPPAGQENFPVVYVSYEDAQAYAIWVGKRLPTEAEWQYAAQAGDGRDWPWSLEKAQRQEQYVTETLTVSKLQVDSSLCNTGNGKLYPVGAYPKGANPLGLQDLVGSVWQLTHDIYDNGSNYYGILKGGSYFLPTSSWWYVEGGPRELSYRQKLLRVSPGFERNATVGFRCVAD